MYNILYVQVSRPDQTDEAFHRLTRLGKFALALVNGPTGRESAISSQSVKSPDAHTQWTPVLPPTHSALRSAFFFVSLYHL